MKNEPSMVPIMFREPSYTNLWWLTLFLILSIVADIFVFPVAFYLFFNSPSSQGPFGGVFIFLLFLMITLGILILLAKYRTVSVDENSIKVKYLLPFRTSFQLRFEDCVGFLTYEQIIQTLRRFGRYSPGYTLEGNSDYFYRQGVILLSREKEVFQVSIATPDPADKFTAVSLVNKNKLDEITKMLDNKGIKKFDPDGKPLSINANIFNSGLSSKNPIALAKKIFFTNS